MKNILGLRRTVNFESRSSIPIRSAKVPDLVFVRRYSKDYYKILGVSKNASEQEIRTAYKKLALQYHPYEDIPECVILI